MIFNISKKIKSNIKIYKTDIKNKGLYWSLIHRFYKIPYTKNVIQPIVNFCKPQFVFIRGKKFFIDKYDAVVSQELLMSGKWEEFETHVFSNHIQKGDVVVDIGAHIGYYTLLAAELVGAKGKVYAFEPDKKNFSILTKNVIENGFNNVVLINKAVSDHNGTMNLYLNKENTGDHSIYNNGLNRESIEIKVVSLDTFFKNKKINCIKMDVQGAEARVLRGAENCLKNNKHVVIFTEFQPALLKASGISAIQFLTILRQFKFSIFDIQNKNKKIINIKTDKHIIKKYPETNQSQSNFTNLLCIK